MQMTYRVETYMHDNCMRLYENLSLHAKLWDIFGFVGPIFTEKFFSKKRLPRRSQTGIANSRVCR